MTLPVKNKTVVFITSSAPSLLRFRLQLINFFISSGFTVVCSAPSFDSDTYSSLKSLGVSLHTIHYDRRSRNPFSFLASAFRYYLFFRRHKPLITFSYFLLPILLTTIPAFCANVPRRFIYFEGLGSIFTSNPFLSFKDRLIVLIVRPLLWLCLHLSCVFSSRPFFINDYDRNTILPFYPFSSKAFITGPIGLDTSIWLSSSNISSTHLASPPVVLFIGRLIYSKGIHQFVKVSELVKVSFPDCRFVVLGGLEHGFDSVPESQMNRWVSSGLIEWYGHVPVQDWIRLSICLFLPSFYREGSPRSIQESMAMGRPVISSLIPSIAPLVEHGVTGFLEAPFNVDAFAARISALITSRSLWKSMSENSRLFASRHFDAYRNAKVLFDIMLE